MFDNQTFKLFIQFPYRKILENFHKKSVINEIFSQFLETMYQGFFKFDYEIQYIFLFKSLDNYFKNSL